ncbi:mechanosensitive ion channel family protein [Streptococcus dysgalactiae subsp. equisimilis SK1249]|nr:mechanosensitive ion channel family protein [Streptococcus dysgalactiae subsp. equisimilis SK1249]
MTVIFRYLEQFHIEDISLAIFSKLVSLVLLLVFFAILKRVSNYLFEKTIAKSFSYSRQSEARQKTLSKLTHNILNYVLYFLLIYWLLSLFGIPVSSLLAGAGIAGVAIGLGAQGFLSDVVNGFLSSLKINLRLEIMSPFPVSKGRFLVLVSEPLKFEDLTALYIIFLIVASLL